MLLVGIVASTVALLVVGAVARLLFAGLKAAHSRPDGAAHAGTVPGNGRRTGHGPLERVALAGLTRTIRLALRVGVRLGPMVMLTVPGRTTGLPRSTPVDLWRDGDRHYLVATHSEQAAWVRNLRAAGTGVVSLGRRKSALTAVELPPDRAGELLRRVLAPRLRRPLAGLVLRQSFAMSPDAPLDDFVAATARHPVFELTLAGPAPGGSKDTAAALGQAPARRFPAVLITLGLTVATAHTVLGLAGRLDTPSWISGAVIGLLLAGGGNHLRIFGTAR